MRILGVDPGLEDTGYGVIEVGSGRGAKLIEAGMIRTRKGKLPGRLASVANQLKTLIEQHKPHLMAVEDLYSYYKTPKPAILMGHVRGVVLGTAALTQTEVASYLPTRIKHSVTGRGHASKRQIAQMVQMRLKLENTKLPDDVTDALAAALCHADTMRKQ